MEVKGRSDGGVAKPSLASASLDDNVLAGYSLAGNVLGNSPLGDNPLNDAFLTSDGLTSKGLCQTMSLDHLNVMIPLVLSTGVVRVFDWYRLSLRVMKTYLLF